jgi:putative phage-type endonuclease
MNATKSKSVLWNCIVDRYDSETEWLEARRSGIGASEVASIFGVGYKTQSPVTIWASKTGIAESEIDEETKKLFRRGHRMETVIALEFEDETGLVCVDPGQFAIYRHPTIDWLFSTLDRFTVHSEFGPVPVELKNVNGRFRGEWDIDQDPPLKFVVQCQTQMAVTGASHCYLVGLIGGDELVIRLIERNQRFIDAMVKKLEQFWAFVERREMPPVDESEATKAMLGLIYPRDTGDEISLPDEFVELDRELVDLKESIKTLETRRDGIENLIKANIGDATRGVLPVGSYSWKAQTRTSVDSEKLAQIAPEVYEECLKVSSFRVLRRAGK